MSLFFKILIIGFLFLTSLKTEGQSCLSADMMILIDWSGSEVGHEKELTNAALKFISDLPIRNDLLRIGVLTFNDQNIDMVDLTGDKDKLIYGINELSTTSANGNTFISSAIEVASNDLNNGRNVRKIIIIISDGEIYDIPIAKDNLNQAKDIMALSVFAVLVGEGLDINTTNLLLLVDNINNIEMVIPSNLVNGLKKLSICN